MDGPNSKLEFAALEKQKDTIEKALGLPGVRRILKRGKPYYAIRLGRVLNRIDWPSQTD